MIKKKVKKYKYENKKARNLTRVFFKELKSLKRKQNYIIVDIAGQYPSRLKKFLLHDLFDEVNLVIKDELYKKNKSCIIKSAFLLQNNNIKSNIVIELTAKNEKKLIKKIFNLK